MLLFACWVFVFAFGLGLFNSFGFKFASSFVLCFGSDGGADE